MHRHAVRTGLRAVALWIARNLDAILPGPPESGTETRVTSERESARRRLQLRLQMLGKRGKGGYR